MHRSLALMISLLLPFTCLTIASDNSEPSVEGKRLSEWVAALNDSNPSVRRKAAEAIGQLGPRAGKAVAPLVETVREDKNRDVHVAAVTALGMIGKDAVPQLIEGLRGTNDAVCFSLTTALGRVGKPAVLPLIIALKDKDRRVRLFAAQALGRVGPNAADGVAALEEALGDGERGVRMHAAYALGEVGPAAKVTLPKLIAGLGDDDAGYRQSVVRTLTKIGIGQEAKDAVKPLIRLFKGSDPLLRKDAAIALGQIGPPAADALLLLMDACSEEDFLVRTNAERAIPLICKNNVRPLVVILKSESAEHRRQAAVFLGRLGASAGDAVEALTAAIRDDNRAVRLASSFALGQVGKGAAAAVVPLIRLLKEDDDHIRAYTVKSLEKIGLGAAAENAVVPLTEVLHIKNAPVRVYAARSLGQIGTAAKSAVPALMLLRKDSNAALREAVEEAIKKIDPGAIRDEKRP